MSMKHYLAARKEAKEHAAQRAGRTRICRCCPSLSPPQQVDAGAARAGADRAGSKMAGTATKGRTTAFSRGFMPLLEPDSEFACKGSVLYDGIVEDGPRQPIVALEYYNRFLHRGGQQARKRHASARCGEHRGRRHRVLPEPEDSERYRVYQEFFELPADTKINFITFTREGSFEKLL